MINFGLRYLLLLLFLLIVIRTKGLQGLVEDQGIPVLTSQQTDKFFETHPVVLVKFTATYCPRCKDVLPEYQKLRQQMEKESNIPVVKIDCEEERDFCQRHKILSFPAIKMFKNSFSVDYRGSKTTEEMYTWVTQRKDTFIDRLDTMEEVDFFSKERISVLYLLSEGDTEALNIFMNAAHQYLDVKFGYSYNQDIIDHFALKSNYSLIFFRQFDEPVRYFVSSSVIPHKRISAFINHLKYPKVLFYSKEVADKLFSERKASFLLFYQQEDCKEISAFRQLAIEKHGRALYFTLVDVDTEEGKKMLKMMGIRETEFPIVRIFKADPNGNLKFKVADLTYDGFKQAFDDYTHERLPRYYLSAPVPETNKGLVKTVVGSTFKKMVLDPQEYILIQAYSPDCSSCKTIGNTFNKLAKNLKDKQNLIFLKMDATENEHISFTVTDYPTIGFFLPRVKSPVIYRGDGSYEDLIEFMESIMSVNLGGKKAAGDL
jgi:protein disulfide-isomerase A1